MKTLIDLTDAFPFKFDVERMKREVAEYNQSGWLDHYDPGLSTGWRAILLRSRHGRVDGAQAQRPEGNQEEFVKTPIAERMPYFNSIMDAFKCPQSRVRILKLAPGAKIGLHTDRWAECGCLAFDRVRLHVPIVTNDKVVFEVNGQLLKLRPGRLYYVNFSQAHQVRNDGDEDRLHLVMDMVVNDWLRQFFPKPSFAEKLEYKAVRYTYPFMWRAHWPKERAKTFFWKHYNGSRLQRLAHARRTKATAG